MTKDRLTGCIKRWTDQKQQIFWELRENKFDGFIVDGFIEVFKGTRFKLRPLVSGACGIDLRSFWQRKLNTIVPFFNALTNMRKKSHYASDGDSHTDARNTSSLARSFIFYVVQVALVSTLST